MPRRNHRHGGRQKRKRPDRYRYVRLADREKRARLVSCACGCGMKMTPFDSQGRRRFYVNRHWMRAAIQDAPRVA